MLKLLILIIKDKQEDSFNNKKNLQHDQISQEKEKELEKEKQIYKAQTLSSYMENIMEYDDTQGVHLQNQSPLKYKRQFSKNRKSYDQFSDPIYSGDVSFDEEIEKTSLDVQKNFEISGNNKNDKKKRQQIYG
ncbi:hypothetical protein PPERSA_04739 [Pseudocohnilembus persalinus]|uniref:Uncharacterized protein n=1 Tax=Pseudocohnilembus persalinus TaxID=266149 RepID=A0A0V0Q882_PSEPJ|nr:hypothetical protein PPERSA_04739 [Pseudocohnilembus persalinus]|eukprot:KRW98451.1 hypothetical protein PPERSA_04739 [Pseudocohnilembus persalinus]